MLTFIISYACISAVWYIVSSTEKIGDVHDIGSMPIYTSSVPHTVWYRKQIKETLFFHGWHCKLHEVTLNLNVVFINNALKECDGKCIERVYSTASALSKILPTALLNTTKGCRSSTRIESRSHPACPISSKSIKPKCSVKFFAKIRIALLVCISLFKDTLDLSRGATAVCRLNNLVSGSIWFICCKAMEEFRMNAF